MGNMCHGYPWIDVRPAPVLLKQMTPLKGTEELEALPVF